MNYRIEAKPSFKMFGKEKIISTRDGENFIDIPKFWEKSFADGTVEALSLAVGDIRQVNGGPVHAVMAYRDTGKDSFPYMIAGFLYDNSKTAGFEIVTIPESEWVIFTTGYYSNETLVETVQVMWKRIFSEWFPASAYKQAPGPELELYLSAGDGKDYCEIWIPIVIK